MTEHPKIIHKTKRSTTHLDIQRGVTPARKFFDELNLTYAPRLVFARDCAHAQKTSIEDFPFYYEDPAMYDWLSATYGPLVDRCYVAPGVISWISPEVGYGYFATRDVSNGEMIGEYTGKIVQKDEVLKSAYAWNYFNSFQRPSQEKISLDATIYGNEMRFVNHSDTPCVRMKRVFSDGQWHIVYVADKDIKRGEEFLVTYGQKYWNNRKKLSW